MKDFAGRFSPQLYAALRIIAGLMFALHGTQKLFGWPGGKEPAGAAMMKFAGVVELAGGLLIALGLFTSVAAFVCAGQMAAAYFMAHARESLAGAQSRRARGALLFRLPLHRGARLRNLERGQCAAPDGHNRDAGKRDR